MKPFWSLLLLALGSCDSTVPTTPSAIPRDRSIVVAYSDSLFAIAIDPNGVPNQSSASHISLGDGRYQDISFVLEGNQLLESGRYVMFVKDTQARDIGYNFLSLSAAEPDRPITLGAFGDLIFTGFIQADNGNAYGLISSTEPACIGWRIDRLEEGRSTRIACATNLPAGTRPQRIFVSDDESILALSYLTPGDVINGDPQDIAILRKDTQEAEIFASVTPLPFDMDYSSLTGDLYVSDVFTGEVHALALGSERRRVVLRTTSPTRHNTRFFLIDGVLVLLTQSNTTTTIYHYDPQSGATKEFTLPTPFLQAYEHRGYLMLRQFAQAGTVLSGSPNVPAEETFFGFCTSALQQPGGSSIATETFQVSLPPFARRTAGFTHSFTCP